MARQSGADRRSLVRVETMTQFGFGLRMTSDLPVPGALPGDNGDSGPVVRIALQALDDHLPELGYSRDREAVIYRHPCGLFRCDRDRIDVAADGQGQLSDLGELLVANALPALLWQQGAFMLHAACVQLPGGPAVAIAGHSGAGKSRLAASLVAAGAELIGDDSLALYATDQGIEAKGLPGGWFARNPEGTERHFKHATQGLARGICPLNLLVVLVEESDEAVRLSPIGVIEQLLLNRHRPQVPLLLGRQAEVLAQAATIARRLPTSCLSALSLIDADPIVTISRLTDLARPDSRVNSPVRVDSDRH
jgi:hypothetical protein